MTGRSMARRWWPAAVFFAIWCAALTAPPLREPVRAVWHQLGAWCGHKFAHLDTDRLGPLAQALPHNAQVQLTYLNSRKYRAKDYDALLARHPGEAWLIAAELNRTLESLRDNRVAGDIENFKNVQPPPEKTNTPVSFTPAELQRSIALAKRGRALEPDNGYFDWVLTMLLLADYRDAEAHRVIHEGSLKPRYDDHAYDIATARIATWELLTPLTFEERVGFSLTEHVSFSRVRHFGALVAWQAWKQERAGRHQEALKLAHDFTGLCAPMMEERNDLLTGLTGSLLIRNVWSANVARRVNSIPFYNRRARSDRAYAARVAARLWADYARTHGRADLGAENLARGEKMARFRGVVWNEGRTRTAGMPNRLLRSATLGGGLGAVIVLQLLLVIFLYFFLALTLRRLSILRVAARDIWLGVATGVSVAMLAGTVAWQMPEPTFLVFSNKIADYSVEDLPVGFALFIFLLAPVLGSAAVAAGVKTRLVRRHRVATSAAPTADVFGTPDRRRQVATFASFSLAALTLSTIAAVIAIATPDSPLAKWAGPSDPEANPFTYGTRAQVIFHCMVGLIALCYFGWIGKYRHLTPITVRAPYLQALRCHQSALGYWMLISSAMFLLAMMVAGDLRREGSRMVMQKLQRGDIAVVEQALAERKKYPIAGGKP